MKTTKMIVWFFLLTSIIIALTLIAPSVFGATDQSEMVLALPKGKIIAVSQPGALSGSIASGMTTTTTGYNNTFLTYDNRALGIQVQYPSNWVTTAHYLGNAFITQFISPPIQNTSENLPAVLSISIQRLTNITTLDQYTDLIYSLLKSVYGGESGFSFLQANNSTSLSGTIPAYERSFNITQHILSRNLEIIPLNLQMVKLYAISVRYYVRCRSIKIRRVFAHSQEDD